MKHYIIAKFNEDYDYKKEVENIKGLFNESLKLDGVNKVEILISNSDRSNRHDLMIMMELTKEGLLEFDNSWIHAKWKNDYDKYISSKTIFDCD